MNALDAHALKKRFGTLEVLPNVSASVQNGRCLAIFGPTGCGKTTFLRICAGLEVPDAGSLYIRGNIANNPKVVMQPGERAVGMVFQDLAIWPHMTVRRHLEFVLHNMDRSSRARRVDELLAEFDLTQNANSRPHRLSRGQCQRLAIVRALAPDPPLILLDEPVSSQDEDSVGRITTSLLDRKAAGTALIVATHDRNFLLSIADDVLVFSSRGVTTVPAADFEGG